MWKLLLVFLSFLLFSCGKATKSKPGTTSGTSKTKPAKSSDVEAGSCFLKVTATKEKLLVATLGTEGVGGDLVIASISGVKVEVPKVGSPDPFLIFSPPTQNTTIEGVIKFASGKEVDCTPVVLTPKKIEGILKEPVAKVEDEILATAIKEAEEIAEKNKQDPKKSICETTQNPDGSYTITLYGPFYRQVGSNVVHASAGELTTKKITGGVPEQIYAYDNDDVKFECNLPIVPVQAPPSGPIGEGPSGGPSDPGSDPDPVNTSTPTNPDPTNTSTPTNPDPDPVNTSTPTNPDPDPTNTSTPTNPDPDPVNTSTPTNPDPDPTNTSTPTNPDPDPVNTSTPTNPDPDPTNTSMPTNPDPDPTSTP